MATTPSLPDQTQLETTKNLPAYVLSHYRAIFQSGITTGQKRYFVLPYSILGSTIIPIIYLTIPHKNRPWLYQARWAIAALMTGLNFDLLTNGTSSDNAAMAYCSGLVACWGLIWGLTVLLVLDPQFEAARVVKRRRRNQGVNGVASGSSQSYYASNDGVDAEMVIKGDDQRVASPAIDESVALIQDEYEHYWQYYPAEASFLECLGWVMDLIIALRGVGWNFATSAIPHPPPPPPPRPKPLSSQSQTPSNSPPVNLASTPQTSRTGIPRQTSYKSFILNRASHILTTLLILDLCTIIARRDPYFSLGPLYPPSTLPPLLTSLHPEILSLLRSTTSFIALLSGLQFYLTLHQLLSFLSLLLSSYILPKSWSENHCATELWQYPSPFGQFVSNVLDGGLSGFWGGFWHQTFRIGFTAPITYLSKHGYLMNTSKRTKQILTMASAFTLSASIHAAGAYTTIPTTTRIQAPFLFFGSSFIGILLEQIFHTYLKQSHPKILSTTPRWLRRTGNLIFVAAWLHFTGRHTFIDDLCQAGVFLFEPIPVSPLRLLAIMDTGSLEGDGPRWWRWNVDFRTRLVPGRDGRWWEGGIRL